VRAQTACTEGARGMMTRVDSQRSGLASILLGLTVVVGATPAGAAICANDPSRTIFAGGPGAGVGGGACMQFTDKATCNMAFHQSGAGPLAPCAWNGSSCFGNTNGRVSGTSPSCEQLPAQQSCADSARTIKLAGGTDGGSSGSAVCQDLTDEAMCETAWHTTTKGVGIACCWTGSGCRGSVAGFVFFGCTHGNTCFVNTRPAAAPAISDRNTLVLAAGLLLLGLFSVRRLARRR
jgi:hypothetical protein